ncbi:TylF/MycF/NovP-related O-methyltransferase [Actinocrispum sp. NPDC049592]|uniref:TylF/MycF/NovP-related O-methyltransferase n=1 Tax=Actinocrispum sp. NPDC049592 TaxID=3154835 RepID=UPI003413949F
MLSRMVKKARYSKAFQRVHQTVTLAPQERMLDMAFAFARWGRLPGDYLEFGVFDGWSLTAAYHLAQKHRLNGMRFLGFDSFDGLPASDDVDGYPFQQFTRGQLKCDQRTVEANLRRDGVDMSKVELTKGWYSDTLTDQTRQRLNLRQAAVVWVDCDLYSSTVPVLDFILPVLQDGTVLIMDDWFLFRAHPDRGERKAFGEWLARNPDVEVTPFAKPGWHEASFIAHLRGDRAPVEKLAETSAVAP